MEPVKVDSYAGSQAEEYPLRFSINKRKVEVIAIEKRWLTPESRCFQVSGNDGFRYVLEYNTDSRKWNLLTINKL